MTCDSPVRLGFPWVIATVIGRLHAVPVDELTSWHRERSRSRSVRAGSLGESTRTVRRRRRPRRRVRSLGCVAESRMYPPFAERCEKRRDRERCRPTAP
eukprot:7236486-Prymnesium_polylepis.1